MWCRFQISSKLQLVRVEKNREECVHQERKWGVGAEEHFPWSGQKCRASFLQRRPLIPQNALNVFILLCVLFFLKHDIILG